MKKILIIAVMSFGFGAIGGYVKSYMNVREYRNTLVAHANGSTQSKYILNIIGVKKPKEQCDTFCKVK